MLTKELKRAAWQRVKFKGESSLAALHQRLFENLSKFVQNQKLVKSIFNF